MLGPQRPLADPGRLLKIEGDLDQVIAAGLGFDLDQLKKRGAEVGLLAALEGTAVPLAGKLGDGKLDERGLLALRGALQSELTRTLEIAVPPTVKTAGPARAAARAAAPAPDALDALIAGTPADDEDEDEEAQP
jgi:hypothetical protein